MGSLIGSPLVQGQHSVQGQPGECAGEGGSSEAGPGGAWGGCFTQDGLGAWPPASENVSVIFLCAWLCLRIISHRNINRFKAPADCYPYYHEVFTEQMNE